MNPLHIVCSVIFFGVDSIQGSGVCQMALLCSIFRKMDVESSQGAFSALAHKYTKSLLLCDLHLDTAFRGATNNLVPYAFRKFFGVRHRLLAAFYTFSAGAIQQCLGLHRFCGSTLAPAKPVAVSPSISFLSGLDTEVFNYRPKTNCFPGEIILDCCHRIHTVAVCSPLLHGVMF